MQIKDVQAKAIKLIATYSNSGIVTPASENLDYTLRTNALVDQAQKEVATLSKIHTFYPFSQNPIMPLNGKEYGFFMKQYLPKTGDLTDISGVDAQSYYFEVDKPCTVYIEQSNDNVNWTTLNTIAVTSISVYTAYRGLITNATTGYIVRLRFTGSYPFNRRNTALWDVPFASANDVPTYRPFVEYELPNNFMEFDKIVHETDKMLYQNSVTMFREGRKVFVVNYFYTGSFKIFYYKVPTDITDSTPDTTELEVYPGMPQEAIAYYVASHYVVDEYPSLANILMQEYQAKLVNLKTDCSGNQQTINVPSGW